MWKSGSIDRRKKVVQVVRHLALDEAGTYFHFKSDEMDLSDDSPKEV